MHIPFLHQTRRNLCAEVLPLPASILRQPGVGALVAQKVQLAKRVASCTTSTGHTKQVLSPTPQSIDSSSANTATASGHGPAPCTSLEISTAQVVPCASTVPSHDQACLRTKADVRPLGSRLLMRAAGCACTSLHQLPLPAALHLVQRPDKAAEAMDRACDTDSDERIHSCSLADAIARFQ